MDPKKSDDDFDVAARNDTAIKGNRAMLEDLAKSFRRVRGDESFDDKGIRTVWHQGRLRTELLSWEDRKGKVVRQEMCFFGMVTEYRQGKPLRTGHLPAEDSTTSSGGRPMSHLVKMDPTPSHQTLDYASHLLKHVPGRDFYAQHLLKHVNDTLNRLGFDEGRTVVSSLDAYSKKNKLLANKTQKVSALEPAGSSTRTIVFLLLATAAVLLGLGLGLLLW